MYFHDRSLLFFHQSLVLFWGYVRWVRSLPKKHFHHCFQSFDQLLHFQVLLRPHRLLPHPRHHHLCQRWSLRLLGGPLFALFTLFHPPSHRHLLLVRTLFHSFVNLDGGNRPLYQHLSRYWI